MSTIYFFESDEKRTDMLNREFFHDVELTKRKIMFWYGYVFG